MFQDLYFLTSLPLFTGIRSEELAAMLKCLGGFKKSYKKNELLLLEGNEAHSVGVVLSGAVHMIKEDEEGEQTLLLTVKEGELFGEAFLGGSHLDIHVSFAAATACAVLFLPFYKVVHVCKKDCAFHHLLIENMLRAMGDKNVQLIHKIEIISKKTLREKIMAYLRCQSIEQNSRQFVIPLGRSELAEYLCAHRSALTRELSQMQKDGVICYKRNTFQLL